MINLALWIENELNENSSIEEVVQKVLYSSKILNFRDDFYMNKGAKQDYSMINWSEFENHFGIFYRLRKFHLEQHAWAFITRFLVY